MLGAPRPRALLRPRRAGHPAGDAEQRWGAAVRPVRLLQHVCLASKGRGDHFEAGTSYGSSIPTTGLRWPPGLAGFPSTSAAARGAPFPVARSAPQAARARRALSGDAHRRSHRSLVSARSAAAERSTPRPGAGRVALPVPSAQRGRGARGARNDLGRKTQPFPRVSPSFVLGFARLFGLNELAAPKGRSSPLPGSRLRPDAPSPGCPRGTGRGAGPGEGAGGRGAVGGPGGRGGGGGRPARASFPGPVF